MERVCLFIVGSQPTIMDQHCFNVYETGLHTGSTLWKGFVRSSLFQMVLASDVDDGQN